MAIIDYPDEGVTLGTNNYRVVETEFYYLVKTLDMPDREDHFVYAKRIELGPILLKVKNPGINILVETNKFLIKCYGRRFNIAFAKSEHMLGMINFNQHDGNKPITSNFLDLGLRFIPKEYTVISFPLIEGKRNERDPLHLDKNTRRFGD